jgi:hypothetical protein
MLNRLLDSSVRQGVFVPLAVCQAVCAVKVRVDAFAPTYLTPL